MKKYKVIEDNGGGLALVVFAQDEETIEYIHTGYEYNPGQLTEDLENLKNGDDPAEDWDNNMMDDEELIASVREYRDSEPSEFEFWFPWDEKGTGWDVVADNEGIYPEEMGAAAKIEFKIKN